MELLVELLVERDEHRPGERASLGEHEGGATWRIKRHLIDVERQQMRVFVHHRLLEFEASLARRVHLERPECWVVRGLPHRSVCVALRVVEHRVARQKFGCDFRRSDLHEGVPGGGVLCRRGGRELGAVADRVASRVVRLDRLGLRQLPWDERRDEGGHEEEARGTRVRVGTVASGRRHDCRFSRHG